MKGLKEGAGISPGQTLTEKMRKKGSSFGEFNSRVTHVFNPGKCSFFPLVVCGSDRSLGPLSSLLLIRAENDLNADYDHRVEKRVPPPTPLF